MRRWEPIRDSDPRPPPAFATVCGSFTTFSSFSVETVQLWERGDRRLAAANAAANLFASLAAIGLAWLGVVVVV